MSGSAGYNPDEWEEKFDKKKEKKYWKHKVTGKATYNDPSKEAKKQATTVASDAVTVASEPAAADSSYNPDEWEEKFDKKKDKKYWKNKVTGKATYNDPSKESKKVPAAAPDAPASSESSYNPDEWEEKFDKKKEKKYWKNKVTGKATYNDPSKEAKKPSDAASIVSAPAAAATSTYNPDEWEEKFDKKKEKKYWKNKVTGKATYNDPSKEAKAATDASTVVSAPAAAESAYNPDEWEEKFDKKKEKKYWKNKVTGRATYNDPSKAAAKASDTVSVVSAVTTANSYNPDEWEEKFDKKKEKKYWKNKVTGKATYSDPSKAAAKATDAASVASVPAAAAATAALAELWEEKLDKKKNKKYWKNKQTGEATYKNPFEAAAGAAKKTPDEASVMSGTSTVATGARDASEWVESYSEKHQRICWKNTVTGKTTYTKPPGWASASGTAAEASGAKVVCDTVRAIVRATYTTAPLEDELESPLHRTPERCLLELTGANQTAEIIVRRFKESLVRDRRARLRGKTDGKADAGSVEAATDVVYTCKLVDLRTLICNEVQGVVSIVLSPGGLVEAAAAVEPECVASGPVPMTMPGVDTSVVATDSAVLFPAAPEEAVPSSSDPPRQDASAVQAPVLPASPALSASVTLHFGSPSMAQAWYALLVKRLGLTETVATVPISSSVTQPAAATSSGSAAPLVVNNTGVDVVILSDAQDTLIGTHSLACADAVLMALETEWLCPTASAEHVNMRNRTAEALAKRSSLEVPEAELSPLPNSGLLLFKVIEVREYPGEAATGPESPLAATTALDSTSSQMKGWMSCWVRLDGATKSLTFYDQGPGSVPSMAVSCEGAALHVSDLTDSALGCECNLYHCTVRNSPTNAKMSVAIKLANAVELYKWVVSLSRLLETVTYCSGGVVHSATQPVDPLQDLPELLGSPLSPLSGAASFPALQASLAETCLGALEAIAERKLCSSLLRHVEVNGAQLKTARFLQINQRIVLLMKGKCSSLTEGSVLLSVNGVNALSTPASTVLKFIADFPRQMKGELTVWKFPRMEFHVQFVKLTPPPAEKDSANVKKRDNALRAAAEGSLAAAEDNRPLDSKGKLNKVIIQKRNSILKISSGLNMSFEGIAHPGVIADLQKELKALEAGATGVGANTPVVEGAQGFTLADFQRSPLTDVKWASVRLMVASGNISILGTDDSGVEVSLARLQLSSCQMKLVVPAQATALNHVAVHLCDNRTHVVVRCASLAMFVDLVECLVIAMKLMGSYPADLSHLYDQSVGWGNTVARGQSGAVASANAAKAQSVLMQTVLATAEEAREREVDAFSDAPTTPARGSMRWSEPLPAPRTPSASSAAPTAATEDADVHILQAAEELEAALSSLHLPANFPTHTAVEKELVELFKLNNANHRLLAEFLTLQFETMNPVPESAIPASRTKSFIMSSAASAAELDDGAQAAAETRYPGQGGESLQHHPFQSTDGSAASVGDDRYDPAPARDSDTALRDKLIAALGAGGPNDEDRTAVAEGAAERDREREKERDRALVERSLSADDVESAGAGLGKASPPSPKDPIAGAARRASLQMRSGSVLMSSAAPTTVVVPTVANRRATFRKSAITHSQEQAAVLLMSQMEKQIMLQSVLTKADRQAVSVLLNHLRNSPQDLVNIAIRFTSATDMKGLAHFVVHRLCVYWSADQRHLEEIVLAAATAEAPSHSPAQAARNLADTLNNSDAKAGLLFTSDNRSLLTRLTGAPTSSGVSFLHALLTEIAGRLDVVVYVQSLCGGISVESLTEDSGVADLCARVVEPFCRRFEAAVVSGTMPIVLVHTLRALVGCERSPIKPLDFIADCVLPHILNTIVEQNKIAETALGACLSDDQVLTILDRIKDMVNLCFNQGVPKHLMICLSDQAALSRSKWYIERSLQFIMQDGISSNPALNSGLSTGGVTRTPPTPSPIARLARIESLSGKSSAMHTLICVRPSELFFILQSMELSNISAAPLSAYSKELSQAITHMHTSDLLQRLHSELRLTPVPATNTTSATSSASTGDSASGHSSTGILDALKEAGLPFLDRELTFLLQISPHSVYHSEFLHHFNDDTTVPLALPVKGLTVPGANTSHNGHGHGNGSFNSTHSDPAADLSALLTSDSVEESEEAHALASIRWLVQAARSALKAMYEHNNCSVVKNQSTVRELQELRHKLLSRREEIAAILTDWKKIATGIELCTNYKAQISLLMEKYRYHKKIAQQASVSPLLWNSTSGVTASAASLASEPAPSTTALLEATANMATAGQAKDAEVQAALSRIVLLQLRLEGELQQTTGRRQETAAGSNEIERVVITPAGVRSASKLAALAALSPLRASGEASTRGKGSNGSHQFPESPLDLLRSRAPNPLHVVMQSVFASTAGAALRK